MLESSRISERLQICYGIYFNSIPRFGPLVLPLSKAFFLILFSSIGIWCVNCGFLKWTKPCCIYLLVQCRSLVFLIRVLKLWGGFLLMYFLFIINTSLVFLSQLYLCEHTQNKQKKEVENCFLFVLMH